MLVQGGPRAADRSAPGGASERSERKPEMPDATPVAPSPMAPGLTGLRGAGARRVPGVTRRRLLGSAGAGLGTAAGPLLAACDAGGGAGRGKRGPAKVVFWNYGGGG